MTTTDRCTSLVFASALFSIFFFDTSMSNNCDNNSKRKSKSKKNAVWWFKLEFQRFMNPLLLCIYREKELFFHFFFTVKKVHLSFFLNVMIVPTIFVVFVTNCFSFLLIFSFSPFSFFSLYLPLLYRLASSCLSICTFFLVSLSYSSVSFLGIAFSVFLVVLCFPLSSFFSPFLFFFLFRRRRWKSVCACFFFSNRNRE